MRPSNAVPTPMLDAALEYARHGDAVFPVWHAEAGRCGCRAYDCASPGKHPVGSCAPNGLKDATTDEATIREWWGTFPKANIATPARAVLDVDPRAGGDESLAQLEAQHGPLPTTPRVLTGGGGWHYHFAPVPGLRNSAGKVGPGLDIRGEGGYVLLPPSNHISGGAYRDDLPQPMYDTPRAAMPAWLVARATAAPSGNGNGTPATSDEWAEKLAGAPLGQRRAVAAEIAGHFLRLLGPARVSEVEEILLGFAARCSPPFPEDEARTLVRDLARRDRTKDRARTQQTPPTSGSAEDAALAALGDATTPATPPWPLYDAHDEWDFAPVEFTVDQLVPRMGVVWWGGLPKRYKSLLLEYLCLSIASDRAQVANRFTIRQRPRILYVTREDGGSRVKERRDDILRAWGVRPPPGALRFVIRPHLDLFNADHVAWLRDVCLREKIGLLVLDTWTALSPSADPMDNRDQAQLAAVVVALAEAIQGAVIVVDHSRKNRPDGQALSSADIFGPLQKWAAAEHIVMLGSTADPRRIEVFIESKDDAGGRFFLAVSPQGSGEEKFVHAGSVENLAQERRAIGDTNRQAVLDTLVAKPEAMSVGELVATLEATGRKLSRDTVQRHVKALVDLGRARRTGSGKDTRYYALTAPPQGPCAAEDGAAV